MERLFSNKKISKARQDIKGYCYTCDALCTTSCSGSCNGYCGYACSSQCGGYCSYNCTSEFYA